MKNLKNVIQDIRNEIVSKFMLENETEQLAMYLLPAKLYIINVENPDLIAYNNLGKLVFNEWAVNHHELTKYDVAVLILHEILHTIFLAFERGKGKNHKVWNIATDIIINTIIKKLNDNLIKFGGGQKLKIFDMILLDKNHEFEGMYDEEIYNKIMEEAKKNGKGKGKGNGKGGDSNPDNYKKVYEDEYSEVWKNESTGTTITVSKNNEGCDVDRQKENDGEKSHDVGIGDSDPFQQEMSVKEIQLKKILRGLSSYGTIGVLKDIEEEYRNLKFTAKMRQLMHSIGKVGLNKSWVIPKKSWMVNRKRLARTIAINKEKKRLFKAVVAVDESGSMSEKDLKDVLGILKSFIHRYIDNEIVFIHHDTDIEVEKLKLSQKNFNDFKLKKRGGTAHGDVFKEIQKYIDEGQKVLPILMSDLYSDIENTRQIVENTQCIWIAPKGASERTVSFLKNVGDQVIEK